MFISSSQVREAETEARNQRIGFAHLLRCDEAKATSAKDVMAVRRIMAAAAERGMAYDQLLRDYGTQHLFTAGALWFAGLDD